MADTWMWDRYWRFDRIASCFDGAGAQNYGESITDGWREFFATLPPGTAILDLCTGNGAVAIVAAEVSLRESRDFRIVAVDQARIDPRAFVTRHCEALALIDFRAGTSVEALPFADSSFGAVISQYGVEYSETERTLAELGRVIAGGGRSRLVVHAAEGKVATCAIPVIAEADLLLDDIDLCGKARRCFTALEPVERGGDASDGGRETAAEAVAAFREALRRVADYSPKAVDGAMVQSSGAVLFDCFARRARLEQSQLLAKVDDVEAEIRAHRERLQALVDAAMDQSSLAALARALRGHGARAVESSPMRNRRQALVGYAVEAHF